MKQFDVKLVITLRKGILDVQGKAVENALHSIDFPMIKNVRIGKFVELRVDAETAEEARLIVQDASNKLIANPIIEDFNIEVVEKN